MRPPAAVLFSVTLLCINVPAQDTLKYDTLPEVFGTWVDYNTPQTPSETKLGDSISRGTESDTTAMLTHDTGICASIPCQLPLPIYTLTVLEPNPCVTYPLVSFTGITDYEWSSSPYTAGNPGSAFTHIWMWQLPPVCTICSESVYERYEDHVLDHYKTTVGFSLVDSIILRDTTIPLITTARPIEISSAPPAEHPDPAQPASLPGHPWLEAVIPNPIRHRSFQFLL